MKQTQTTGDSSIAIQAEHVHLESSPESVRVIAKQVFDESLDTFQRNFIRLSEEAQALAEARATSFVNKWIERVAVESPLSLQRARDPDMQYLLYAAQTGYARSGEWGHAEVVLELLVERARAGDESLSRLVLNGAIEVSQRLTRAQMDLLTVALIAQHVPAGLEVGSESADDFVAALKPFLPSLSASAFTYSHIFFTGCALPGNRKTFEGILLQRFPFQFLPPFTIEDWRNGVGKKNHDGLLKKSGIKSRLTLRARSYSELAEHVREIGGSPQMLERVTHFVASELAQTRYFKEHFAKHFGGLEPLWQTWNGTDLGALNLTSVGTLIAVTNFRRRTGKKLEAETLERIIPMTAREHPRTHPHYRRKRVKVPSWNIDGDLDGISPNEPPP